MRKLISFALSVSCFAIPLSALIHAGNSQASSLVEEDWLVPGDGLLTKDLSTGLKWLDLTETLNQSLEQLMIKMEPGGPLEGFWLASTAELDSLYIDADLSLFISTSGIPWSTDPAVVAAAEDFLDLLGVTMTYPAAGERGLGGRHAPLYAGIYITGANLFVDEDGGLRLIGAIFW